jgi:uncharacterized membrane protein (GlpM family)
MMAVQEIRDVRPKVPARSGVSPLTMLLVFPLFIGGILFMPTSALIIAGMLPTMACLLIDRDAQRYTTITVGLMNAAGVIPYLVQLWMLGESMDHMMTIIANPIAWLTMYGAATVGWFLFFTVPHVVQTLINQKIKLKIISLDHKQTAMVREWGEDIRLGEPTRPQS